MYAVVADTTTLGFFARLVKVTPKALALAALLLPAAAIAAAYVGRRLARPIEDLTEAATRIAEGHRTTKLPRGEGDEMRRLARALVSMRRELEGKPYAAAFLRDAWHDLKTPVAALQATLEVLDDDAFDDPPAARHFLENLRRSTDQLERTLADLVTLARYETASLAADEPARMGALLEDAVERVVPLAEATNVVVSSRKPAASEAPAADRLSCDPAAITRALGNLLENAVTATPGGKVEIAMHVDEHDSIIVDVINEPAVIPPDARRTLFERAPKSRGGRGSGLGLAMVRAAVEAHGGTIRFVEMGPPRVRVRLELPR
jgi:signal transduction histidine kinase